MWWLCISAHMGCSSSIEQSDGMVIRVAPSSRAAQVCERGDDDDAVVAREADTQHSVHVQPTKISPNLTHTTDVPLSPRHLMPTTFLPPSSSSSSALPDPRPLSSRCTRSYHANITLNNTSELIPFISIIARLASTFALNEEVRVCVHCVHHRRRVCDRWRVSVPNSTTTHVRSADDAECWVVSLRLYFSLLLVGV